MADVNLIQEKVKLLPEPTQQQVLDFVDYLLQKVPGQRKFNQLVSDWRAERGAMSSLTETALCPAYQAIIGMGQLAVPFILAQLESEGEEPDQWFWALRAITGANPVPDGDRGNYLRMAQTWIQWGKDKGYAR